VTAVHDEVNHPAHYRLANGAQVIDVTENLSFNRGNAVKYICRAGNKDGTDELTDLHKARWYLNREIDRVEAARESTYPYRDRGFGMKAGNSAIKTSLDDYREG
jgi:Protein of unknwon function (DUF3310)